MISTILIALAVVAGIAVVIAITPTVVGAFLPAYYHSSRSKELDSHLSRVWEYISDYEKVPLGIGEVLRVESAGKNKYGFPMWKEYCKGSQIVMNEIIEFIKNEKIVIRTGGAKALFSGTWALELSYDNGKTLLRITEDFTIPAPASRFLFRFIIGYETPVNKYFRTLEQVLTAEFSL